MICNSLYLYHGVKLSMDLKEFSLTRAFGFKFNYMVNFDAFGIEAPLKSGELLFCKIDLNLKSLF